MGRLVAQITDSQSNSASQDVEVEIASSGGAPAFGDDSADTLIWAEDFESYATEDDADLANGGPWAFGSLPSTRSTVDLDTTGGRSGGQAFKFINPAGTSGGDMARSLSVQHDRFFFDFWFKLARAGEVTGKWLILIHSAGHNRYQIGITSFTPPGLSAGGFGNGRLTGLQWEDESGGALAVNPDDAFDGYVWGGAANEMAPVLTGDPGLAVAGWDPADDGNFHRLTGEIQTGSATAAYCKLYYDGNLYYDSEGHDTSFTGIPNEWKFDCEAGSNHDPYDVWWDDLTAWSRG